MNRSDALLTLGMLSGLILRYEGTLRQIAESDDWAGRAASEALDIPEALRTNVSIERVREIPKAFEESP